VVLLVASISASVWANCIAEIGMKPSAQMLCCKDGHDKCPMHNTAADCCKVEGQRHQEASFATHETATSVVNPPAIFATPVALAVTPTLIPLPQSTFNLDVLKGPDPPPYLVGSAFLV
jgi:hypothetical protein